MAYVLEKNPAEAVVWHRKATQLTPGNERYWGNLALALRWTPLAADAPEAFRHAIELGEREVTVNPREPEIHARLGEYWAALGNTANGKAEIGRALALAPASGYVQFRAALVYEQFGDRKRALKALRVAMTEGYSAAEIAAAVPLKNLFGDPAYQKLVNTFKRKENRSCLNISR
jgi:tetratricopeptide (TPR) repeat protein